MLIGLLRKWRGYRHRFVPWIAVNLKNRSKRVIEVGEKDKIVDDNVLLSALLRLLPHLQSTVYSSLPAAVVAERNVNVAESVLGFCVVRAPSKLPGAGIGVRVARGSIKKGSLVALYPGTLYHQDEPVLLPSIGNAFVLRCLDGIHVDGNNRRMSKMIYKSCVRRDSAWPYQTGDLTWLTEHPVMPLNIGQYVNNHSPGFPANVAYQEITIPLSCILPEHRCFLPNVWYSSGSCCDHLRLVALVSIENIEQASTTMALSSRPEFLLNLSVEALVNYVSQLLLQLVTFPQYTAADNLKQHYVEQTCRGLCVYWKLPSSLVNEVTAKLLHCINKTYSDIYYSVYRQWGDEVLPMVLSAVLHPSLTRLECVGDLSHTVECQEFMWDRLFLTIHGVVCKFPNLKVLKYGYIRRTKDWIISDINVSANLEHLWFLELCNDKFLENVAAKCRRLKSIDVSNSSNVTDESIQYLLKFEHLEGLNVSCTGISERGLARLLVGLSQARVFHSGCSNILKSFGSINMTSFEIDILAREFQNLTSVNLCPKDESSFSPLKTLKHLSRLTLSWMEFYQAEDLLFSLGPQLVFLELYHVYNVKMSVIGEMCPLVRCLHISSGSFLETEEEIDFLMDSRHRSCRSVFGSVVCLHLEFPRICTEYLLSECKQVKKLYVRTGSRCARQLLESVLRHNQLTQLEKYHWGTCTKMGGDVIVSRPTEESISMSVVDPFQRNVVLLRTEEVILLQDQPHSMNTDTANTGCKDMH